MLWWVRLVVRRRGWVLGGLLLVSLLSLWSLRDAVIATSIQRMLLGADPAYRSYQARAEDFGGDEILVVAYADPSPLSPAATARLTRAVGRIAQLPEVGEVQSLLDVLRVQAVDGVLEVQPYVALGEAATAALEAEPAAAGLLRSDDRQHSALVVALRPDPARPSEVGPLVMEQVTAILTEEGMTDLHRAGFLATVSGVLQETRRNLTRLLPLSVAVVVLSVYALFRRALPAAVASAVSLMAMLWTMGFSVQLDPEVNLFSAVVPAVILVVAISDAIHLWSAYLLELAEGHSQAEAIERSVAEVGVACLLTSATTFLGFISLCLIPTPLYRQVGLVLSVGVSAALLITVTLMPVLMSLLPAPAVLQGAASPEGAAGRGFDRLAALTTHHAGKVVVGFALLTALSAWGASRIRLDADLMARMSASSALRQETTFVRTHFAGSNPMEVFVDTPAPDGALDPALLAALQGWQAELIADPEVGAAHSLVDVVGTVHRELSGAPGLPDSSAAVAQYMLLLELSEPDALAPLVDFERRTLRVLTRLRTGEIRRSHDLARAAEQAALARLGPGFVVEATGLSVLFGGFIDDLVAGQRSGLLFSLATIAGMMVLGLRSLRCGLASMLPNLLPLLAVAGLAGWVWSPVDSDIALVGMIAIGIGVDDTIHFLVCLRLEADRAPMPEAIRRTFRFAGRGIVFTTIILTLGFLPMALSDYFSIWIMGTLLPGALIIALIADLLLVPAMAALGVFRWPSAAGAGARKTA